MLNKIFSEINQSSERISLIMLGNHCRCADDKPYVPTFKVSEEKAKSLGIDFIPLDVSLKETVESLKQKGYAKLLASF